MRHRLLGRLLFLGGCGAWAWRAAGLLPFHYYKFNYLDSLDWGFWATSEWVHPLFVPLLALYKAALGLAGSTGAMAVPLGWLNLTAGALTLAVLFLLAERLCRDSLLSAAGVLAVGFTPLFLTGTLGMNPYALAALCSTVSLALLCGLGPSRGLWRFALAGGAAGLGVAFHTAAIALVPTAALAAWLEAGSRREAARRLGAFLAALAAALIFSYAAFILYHGIPLWPLRSAGLAFREIEQVPGSSLYTSRDLGLQVRDFLSVFHEGKLFLAFLVLLAALWAAASLLRRAGGTWGIGSSAGARRGAALAAACALCYALFFIINSSINGFAYAVLLPVPLLLAALAAGEPLLRLLLAPLLLAALGSYWDRGSVRSEVWVEARFLDAALRPGDVLVLPGKPLPDLLHLRTLPVLQADGAPSPDCSLVPVLRLEELVRGVRGVLGRGRRVFFQTGDVEAQFADGRDGIDFAPLYRQLFTVDAPDPAARAWWIRAVRRRLEGEFGMVCGYRSEEGWEYCRLRPGRRAASAAGASAAPEDVRALTEALLSVPGDPFLRRKTLYLKGWLDRWPEDGFVLDEIAGLAAAHIQDIRPNRDTGEVLRLLDIVARRRLGDADVLLLRAERLFEAGRRAETLGSLRRLPARGLSDARLADAADLYWRLGEYGALSDLVARAGRERSLLSGLWLRGAEAARRSGRRADARLALSRAEAAGLNVAGFLEAANIQRSLGDDAAFVGFVVRADREGRRLDAGLWLDGAEAARRSGRREAARLALSRAEAAGLDDAGFARAAALYAALGDHGAQAEFLLRTGRGGRRLDAGTWLRCAESAQGAGQRAAALLALAQAEKLGLDEARFVRAADLYWALDDHGALAALVRGAGRGRALDAGLWTQRAEAARRAGQAEAARAALAAAQASSRIEPRLLCRLGLSAQALGDMETARRVLARLEADPGQDAGFWLSLARAAVLAGDAQTAEQALARSTAPEGAGGGVAEAGRLLGLLESRGGRRAADAAVLAGLAGMAARAGDDARARRTLKDAEGSAASAAELRSVASVYQSLGDHAAALRLYDRLVAQDPSQARWLGDRGVLRALLGQPASAIADLEAALARDPSLLSAQLTLGSLYAAQGDRKRARLCYDQAARRADSRTPAALLRMIRRAQEGAAP